MVPVVAPAHSGMSGMSGVALATLVPPPGTLQAYYEASLGTLDAGGASADNFEKIATWNDISPVGDAHNLVQTTVADQLRVRKTTAIPLVYANWKEETATQAMATTGMEIDQRNSTFFALVELDILVVQSATTDRIIMSLPGSVGDLSVYTATGEPSSAVLRWRDASGTTTTTIRVQSGLALVGIIFDAAEIRLFYNGQSATIATPLAAGTSTGFTLRDGSVGTGIVGGYNCIGWYDHAIDSTELADLRTWAIVRKALSAPTRDVIMAGASIGLGVSDTLGNLNAARRYVIGRGDCSYRNISFSGNTSAQQQGHIQGLLVGWAFPQPVETAGSCHNPDNMQLLIMHCPTNDVYTGVAEATIITNLTTIRKTMRAYGYQLIFITMAPVGTFDAAMETKRLNINAAMAALDSREYGICIPYPAEMTNPADTTYYDADQTHWTSAAYDLVYDDIKATADSLITVTPTALQTWVKLNGDYTDSSIYQRDWQAVGSPSFVSGLWGRQALRTTTGGNYARGKNNWREFDVAEWSIMFWFRTTETGTTVMFSKYSGTGGAWYTMKHSTGSFRAVISGMSTLTSSSTYYHDGNWHVVAISVDAVGGKLYGSADHFPANLTLQASQSWTTVPVVPNSAHYWKAGSDNASSFNADFQDCMAWFGSKTLAEFQAISLA